MSMYTKEVQAVFNTLKNPVKRFYVDIVEYSTHLALRIYTENLDEELSEGKRVLAIEHVMRLRDAIAATGVPCLLEKIPGPVPNRGQRVSNR